MNVMLLFYCVIEASVLIKQQKQEHDNRYWPSNFTVGDRQLLCIGSNSQWDGSVHLLS